MSETNKLTKQAVASVAGGAIAYAATMPAITGALSYVGFTSGGVAAGSWAATMQAPFTLSGSPFALGQALGATGAATLAPAAPAAAGVAGVAVAAAIARKYLK